MRYRILSRLVSQFGQVPRGSQILLASTLGLLAMLPVVSQRVSAQDGPAPTLQERYPRYRVHAGDVLDVNFPFTPEFNQTVTVQPDGFINLRGLGDMHVQDKSTPQVVEIVRKAYSKILRDPDVTVELKD